MKQGDIFPIDLLSPLLISAHKIGIFFCIFQSYFCDYEHVPVDTIMTWKHLSGDCQEVQEGGYSTGKVSWDPRVSPAQLGGYPSDQGAGEQRKAMEATGPIDRPVSSAKGKVTSEKGPRSVQESQMEIWCQQTTGLEPVTPVMQLRKTQP